MMSLKLITATDTQYSGALLKTFDEQRSAGLFCDVTIIVQDRKFRAHKNVLSASSSYFHQLCAVGGQVIELNFVKAEIFEEILNYIYSSKLLRVRSDRLLELIQVGQTLGVKFIANLGVLLSRVRGLPGLSKVPDGCDPSGGQSVEENTQDKGGEGSLELRVPIVTEEFSLSVEDFDQPDGNTEQEGGPNSDDVLFVSKEGPRDAALPPAPGYEGAERCSAGTALSRPSGEKDESTKRKGNGSPEAIQALSKWNGDRDIKDAKPSIADIEGTKSSFLNNPPQVQLGHHALPSSLTSPIPSPLASPNTSTVVAHPPLGFSSFATLCSAPSDSAHISSSPVEPLHSPQPRDVQSQSKEVLGVQKKQVTTVLEKTEHQTGDFKLKLSDMRSSSSRNGPKTVIVGKKTITSDKASEIDSLSTGCKVYANIGENTYDIVPMKEDPGEGDSKTSRIRKSQIPSSFSPDTSPQSPRGASSKKKAKIDQNDHYELIMDGKTFYVCVVCKRPYVCLTSLRRHFNTHSWEKKYPCRYCDKVFALAEYRTKHEIYHTGERRYQCLLCNEFFINYQLLSSHCKQVHNQDPSGRKEKDDTDNNLYRLLPCKTLQFKPYSYVSENTGGIPIISEEGIVYHLDPGKGSEVARSASGAHVASSAHLPSSQSKVLNWDDIFEEPGAQTHPQAHPQTQHHPPTHPQAHPQTQPHPQNHPQPHPPTHPQAHPQTQPHPSTHPQAHSQTQPHPPTHPQTPTQPHPPTHPQTPTQPHTPTHPQAQPQAPAQPHPPTHPQAQTQTHPQAQTQTHPPTHPQAQTQTHSPTHPQAQTQPHPSTHPQTHSQTQLHPQAHPQTQPHPQNPPQTHPQTQPHTQSHPPTQPHPQTHPQTPQSQVNPAKASSEFEFVIPETY